MRKFIISFTTFLIFISTAIAVHAAETDVGIDIYGPSPDPVNINVGDVVYWVDSEPDLGLGPYLISGPWGTFYTPGGIQFMAAGSYQYSAESMYGTWSGTVNVSVPVVDSPPIVSLTSPANNSQFIAPATFSFAADASDPDPNDVMDVEFWVGTNMVDDVFSPPYSTTVTNLAAGTYTLTAIVSDYSYVTATNSVVITVVGSAPVSLTPSGVAGGKFIFSVDGLVIGKTNVLLCSSNLIDWVSVQTNVAGSSAVSFTNSADGQYQFFRVMQLE